MFCSFIIGTIHKNKKRAIYLVAACECNDNKIIINYHSRINATRNAVPHIVKWNLSLINKEERNRRDPPIHC